MQKLYLESLSKSTQNKENGMQYHLAYKKQKSGTTLSGKVQIKNEIMLTRKQLKETTWLFKQYGIEKPGWLRMKFTVNQRRTKLLNDNLCEAQLDKSYCGKCKETENWCNDLHTVWHKVNKVELCS